MSEPVLAEASRACFMQGTAAGADGEYPGLPSEPAERKLTLLRWQLEARAYGRAANVVTLRMG